jgi:ABC-type nitrate/sulfonate/bicarbonate transport system substrate-binding protein
MLRNKTMREGSDMNPSSFAKLAAWALLSFTLPAVCGAQDYIDRYGLSVASPAVNMGVQPLGYPSGVISAVMQRDRILKKALEKTYQPLQAHAFKRGADMIPLLADQRLEAGLLGDMPTLLSAATGRVLIVGLVKQTSTSIVAKGDIQVGDLAGKRIGVIALSSAHHTLLQGLASANISEKQVTLVPLGIEDMPDALERGDISAFAAWEPAPTAALAKDSKNRIVFRGLTADYFVVEKAFAERSPKSALHLVAGYMRAMEWMRRSQVNLDKAARWVMADGEAFSTKPATLSVSQISSITRRDILDIPSAPAILQTPAAPPLKTEFQFLSRLGKLPAGATWANVEKALAYDGLAQVLGDARTYQLRTFDYAD